MNLTNIGNKLRSVGGFAIDTPIYEQQLRETMLVCCHQDPGVVNSVLLRSGEYLHKPGMMVNGFSVSLVALMLFAGVFGWQGVGDNKSGLAVQAYESVGAMRKSALALPAAELAVLNDRINEEWVDVLDSALSSKDLRVYGLMPEDEKPVTSVVSLSSVGGGFGGRVDSSSGLDSRAYAVGIRKFVQFTGSNGMRVTVGVDGDGLPLLYLVKGER